jgi:hypothetical protein
MEILFYCLLALTLALKEKEKQLRIGESSSFLEVFNSFFIGSNGDVLMGGIIELLG